MAVLLEEHPLQHFGPSPAVVGHKSRALPEVPEDRARLCECPSVFEFQQRDAAVRILVEKLRLARRAVVQAVLLQCERDTELARGEPRLVTVAGHLHLMEHGHAGFLRSSRGPRIIW
jgi:hypothetical protein